MRTGDRSKYNDNPFGLRLLKSVVTPPKKIDNGFLLFYLLFGSVVPGLTPLLPNRAQHDSASAGWNLDGIRPDAAALRPAPLLHLHPLRPDDLPWLGEVSYRDDRSSCGTTGTDGDSGLRVRWGLEHGGRVSKKPDVPEFCARSSQKPVENFAGLYSSFVDDHLGWYARTLFLFQVCNTSGTLRHGSHLLLPVGIMSVCCSNCSCRSFKR